MKPLTFIQDYIAGLDERQLTRYMLIFLAIFLALVGYLIYRKYDIREKLENQIAAINKQRRKTQQILERNNDLKKQREQVNELLSIDKDFRLLDYFERLIKESNLKPSAPASVSIPHDLEIGYNEVELSSSFNNLNMKQLVELLERIDKNKRVYLKELIIDKSSKSASIDIKLVIATLEPLAVA